MTQFNATKPLPRTHANSEATARWVAAIAIFATALMFAAGTGPFSQDVTQVYFGQGVQ